RNCTFSPGSGAVPGQVLGNRTPAPRTHPPTRLDRSGLPGDQVLPVLELEVEGDRVGAALAVVADVGDVVADGEVPGVGPDVARGGGREGVPEAGVAVEAAALV